MTATWADILRDPAIWIGVAISVAFYSSAWWIGKLWPNLECLLGQKNATFTIDEVKKKSNHSDPPGIAS